MTTERQKLIDPSRIDNSLIRRRFARMAKADLVEMAVGNFEREVDLLNDIDQLRRERNEEALARSQAAEGLSEAQARIVTLEDKLAYYRGLLRTVSQSMGPLLQNAYRRGWHAYSMRLTEVQEERRLREPKSWVEVAAQQSQALVDNVSIAANKTMSIIF